MNESISEMGHFQSLLTSGSPLPGENETNDIIYAEDKVQGMDNAEVEDYVVKRNPLQEKVRLPSMITSEPLVTLDSAGPSSDSDQNSSMNADKWQNYNLQYTNTENCKQEESNVLLGSDAFNLQDLKKQGSYTQHTNVTEDEELEWGSLLSGTSECTFNVNDTSLLSSTMKPIKVEDIVQDDTLCIVDLVSPCEHTFSPECMKSEPTEKTEDNKNTSDMQNLEKLFKSMNEEIAVFRSFLNETGEVEITGQPESKPLQKALRQLHIHAQSLGSENLQCREQINRLRTEKTYLHIQLSIAEQDAEAYHQQAKAMTDKCEELLTQRKQIQDERDHLSFQMQLLTKEKELLKEEKNKLLKDLSAANTEKEKLIKKLNSSKKMTLLYAREKQEIHRKWNEALMENYHLRIKADECRSQHMKSNDINNTENKMQGTDNIEEEACVGKCNSLQETIGLPLMETSEQFDALDSTGPSTDSDQNSPVKDDTCKNYNLQYTNTDNCKEEESYESEAVNLCGFQKEDSFTLHANGMEEIECGRVGMSDSTYNVNGSGPMSSTMKLGDIAQDETLCITHLIPPCDYTHFSPELKESEPTLEDIEDNEGTSEIKNLDNLFKSMNEEIAWLKGFLSEADRVKLPSQFESKPLQNALRQLNIHSQSLSSENLQCREQIDRLRTEKMSLQIQLCLAEQDAEAYHQQAKAITDKCEEILKQRKNIQDERDHLSLQLQLLTKEIELMKGEKKMCLKDLSAANTEKEELIKKLDSIKKMALVYSKEKQEIHYKWNEALMENYHLRKKVEECRTQHEKHEPYKWSIRAFYQ